METTALTDVAIGLSLVYLGASLFVTIINEYLAQALKLRAKKNSSSHYRIAFRVTSTSSSKA